MLHPRQDSQQTGRLIKSKDCMRSRSVTNSRTAIRARYNQDKDTEQKVFINHYQRGLENMIQTSLDPNCTACVCDQLSELWSLLCKAVLSCCYSAVCLLFPEGPKLESPETQLLISNQTAWGNFSQEGGLVRVGKQEKVLCQELWPLGHLHFASNSVDTWQRALTVS